MILSMKCSYLFLSYMAFPFRFGTAYPNPAPVPLGAAGTYGVLSAVSVTSTGPTVVNGNLGEYPGTSVTGFPPGTVTGEYYVADAYALTAQQALATAIVDANSRTPDATVSGDISSQTLSSGVYFAPSSLAISGTLYLDAENDPLAVWIFQIGSTLTIGTGGSVVVINKTSSNPNIFWSVGSSATIEANANLLGVVLAAVTITVNTGAVTGPLLASGAAVTLLSNTITAYAYVVTPSTSPTTVTYPIPLPVPLGVAASFAVLSGVSVTNSGPTVVNGNLGEYPGTSVTAFPPGMRTGQYYIADSTALSAQQALTAAIANANSRASDATVSGDISGQTFIPGVYTSASSISIAGTVYLDAQDNPLAVWIFQMGSTLILGMGAKVVLINSATGNPQNIFWSVGSSATIGVDATLIGVVLAAVTITANTGAVTGPLLASIGAVTLLSNTITAYNLYTSSPSAAPISSSSTSGTSPPTSPSTNSSFKPTSGSTVTPLPTVKTSALLTATPSATHIPTVKPTTTPTATPTHIPTVEPSTKPTATPTHIPTMKPTTTPTATPTHIPTVEPSTKPTATPTHIPTVKPSTKPTESPSVKPSFKPTHSPTVTPSSLTSSPSPHWHHRTRRPHASKEPSKAPTKYPHREHHSSKPKTENAQ